MSPELVLVAKFAVVFLLAMLAIFWLSLPFAVWAIKSRLEAARAQRDEVLQELFRLRKTMESLPGAKSVARRKAASTIGRAKQGKAKKEAPAPPAEKPEEAITDDNSAKKTKSKSATKPVATPPREKKEPTVSKVMAPKPEPAPRPETQPAASLIETDDLDDEQDFEDEYDEEFQNRAGGANSDDDEYTSDEEDYEDDSLEFLQGSNDPSSKMIEVPLTGQSSAKTKAQAMTQRIIVDLPSEDEIEEDGEGYFVYRGERFENLIDAMRQQQLDAQEERSKAAEG